MKKEREHLVMVQQAEEREKTYSERLQHLTKVGFYDRDHTVVVALICPACIHS
jgi:hypothetical protein